MYFEVRETQSGLGTSRTGYQVGTGYQSDWIPSRDWVPVRLGDRSDWYPVTQSGTGTGASLTDRANMFSSNLTVASLLVDQILNSLSKYSGKRAL